MSLLSLARSSKDVIKPFGETDVLLYYSVVAQKLKKFLRGKEIASKIWLPKGMPFFIKRGSKDEPLFIEDFSAITEDFFSLRKKHLKDVKEKLTKKQELIWRYFVPRKLSDFFYATNGEKPHRPIERLFFDIDRGSGVSSEHAWFVTKTLVEVMKEDIKSMPVSEPFVCWTGSSFHVFLFLDKPKPEKFYEKYFQFSKNREAPETLTEKWVLDVQEKLKNTDIRVVGGHDKRKNIINIDPSQTPSGKLCRAPFSLHMSDAKTINGVDIPLDKKMLYDSKIVSKLKAYTPNKVIKDLDKLARNLPKKFQ